MHLRLDSIHSLVFGVVPHFSCFTVLGSSMSTGGGGGGTRWGIPVTIIVGGAAVAVIVILVVIVLELKRGYMKRNPIKLLQD